MLFVSRRLGTGLAVTCCAVAGLVALPSGAVAQPSQVAPALHTSCRLIDGGPGSIAGTDGAGTFVGTFPDQLETHIGTWTALGERRDLGVLPDTRSVFGPGAPTDINQAGVVVGSTTTIDDHFHAFVLRDGTLQHLPEPSGSHDSVANGIDNAGNIVGTVSDSQGTHAALWPAAEPGTVRLLQGGQNVLSHAYGIDEQGHIVGDVFATTTGGAASGQVWALDGSVMATLPVRPEAISGGVAVGGEPGFRIGLDGSLEALDDPVGSVGSPSAINASGVVVGGESNIDTFESSATIWPGTEPVILPGPAGRSSSASSVDDDNVVGGVVGDDAAIWVCLLSQAPPPRQPAVAGLGQHRPATIGHPALAATRTAVRLGGGTHRVRAA